ncbi:hypothetical protein FBUS_10522 [Fasciolopsis buskii]|uniref:Uncharacterized protein n=1 Tax=Fasciolopsis buskii TaxID=27845 RepID=A0A8E0RU42_9TREM|nr:hypothetical protein FBUS_10522 [Fasciolopsis buski]
MGDKMLYRRPSAELEAEAMRENQEIIDRAEQNGVHRPSGANTAAGLIVMPSRLMGTSTGSTTNNGEKSSLSAPSSTQPKSAVNAITVLFSLIFYYGLVVLRYRRLLNS